MKINLPGMFAISLLILLSSIPVGAATDDTNPPPRLTVELRDGSRVVGTSAEKFLKFRSVLLGEIKLDVKDIRAVECVSSNSAKLSTANGDTLTVSFVDSDFAIKTSFGKVDLQMDSVRRFSMSGRREVRAHPPGLVALWAGEGEGNDSVGGDNGTLTDITFTDGKAGQAFSFNGTSSSIRIPASPALDVGSGSGFTVMAWINPTDVTQNHPLFEWNDATYWGVHFHIAPGQPTAGSSGQAGMGQLYANIVDSTGGWHQLGSSMGVVSANDFQQVALTYDRASGLATIYRNGQIVSQQNIGSFVARTAARDLYLGRRPAPSAEVGTFAGLLDEAAVFDRALSPTEIREEYDAGSKN
jgi:hypothetical protein